MKINKGFLVLFVLGSFLLINISCGSSGGGGDSTTTTTTTTSEGTSTTTTVAGATTTTASGSTTTTTTVAGATTTTTVGTTTTTTSVEVTTTTAAGTTTTTTVAAALLKWSAVTPPMNYCSPAIDENGRVYVGSHLSTPETSGAMVYAFTSDGTQEWAYTLGQNYDKSFLLGAIALDNSNNSYFLVGEYDPAGGDSEPVSATYLMSLNSSGSFRWRSASSLADAHGWIYATEDPAIAADGTIFVGSGSKLYAVDSSAGTTKWYYDFNEDGGFNNSAEEGAVEVSSPVIDSDGKVYVNVIDYTSNTGYGIYCFSPEATTGEVVWQAGSSVVQKEEDYFGPPSIDETLGRIYAARSVSGGGGSTMYALSQSMGALIWSATMEASLQVFSSPSIGSDGTLYFGTSAKPEDGVQAGIFYALNPDGSEKWTYDTSSDVDGSRDIYTSAAIGDDGTVYFASEFRYVYAFSAAGTLIRKYDLYAILPSGLGSGTITHTSFPIANDGTLYCGDLYGATITGTTAAFYAINTDSSGLGSTDWPKYRYNNKNTGRVE